MPTPADIAAAFIEAGDWSAKKGDAVKGAPGEVPALVWYQRAGRHEEQAVLLLDLVKVDMTSDDCRQQAA